MVPAVAVENLTYYYGDRPALAGVDLEIPGGAMFGILGPNGSGKTTLFRILATLAVPASGQVAVAGQDVVTRRSEVRRALGVVFQTSSLDDKLTVTENLRHHGHLYGCYGVGLREQIDELLQRLQLQDRAADRVETLSGGLQRRVELARCLLHRPEILLLDEPTAGLDPTARLEYWRLLAEIQERQNATVIFTTHWFEEAERASLLAIMDSGRLVACESPATLKSTISRDVVTIHGDDPAALAAAIAARFDCDAVCVGNAVRIESASATVLLPRLLEAFEDQVHSISASKATLEDVYVQRTGKAFDAEEPGQ